MAEKTAEASSLRLSYKRTFIIGLAFFTINLLWYIYNTQCPLILEKLLTELNGAGDYKYLIGIIMAMDNVFAIVMLPVFGRLSDKTKTKIGKRMPYIIIGTVASAIAFPFIIISYICDSLAGVIVSMAMVIFFMQMYRSPAVALMPDVTPKPLRSKANGIINFVGYVGAIFGGLLLMIAAFRFDKTQVAGSDTYIVENPVSGAMGLIWPFIITAALMIAAIAVVFRKINENRLKTELKDEMIRGESQAETVSDLQKGGALGRVDKRNLILIIVAEFLWFMGFNGLETFWSTYCIENLGSSNYATPTIILTIASLATFIPAGFLAGRIGRKWTIVIGIAVTGLALAGGLFVTSMTAYVYIMFALAGIGWATINVASYPMVVEFSTSETVGRFTGIYYFASMLAQSITPVLIGFLMDRTANAAFFPYSVTLFGLAFAVFLFVKNVRGHKIVPALGIEALDQD